MIKFLFFIIFFLLLNQNNSFSVDNFNEALTDCYYRYAQQKEFQGDGEGYLYFKSKAEDVKKGIINPENPIDFGVNIEDGLDIMLPAFDRLNLLLSDNYLKKKEYNILSHSQCLYDCWIFENKRGTLGIKNASQCRIYFFTNIESIENEILNKPKIKDETFIEIQEQKKDYEYEGRVHEAYCDSIYFDQDSYIPPSSTKIIIERIIKNTGLFRFYHIFLTGYIDSKTESFNGKLLAKQRAMFVKDILTKNGVPQQKITGQISDGKDLTKYDKIGQILKRRVKICVINALNPNTPGNNFIEKFDYKESEKNFAKDINTIKSRPYSIKSIHK